MGNSSSEGSHIYPYFYNYCDINMYYVYNFCILEEQPQEEDEAGMFSLSLSLTPYLTLRVF